MFLPTDHLRKHIFLYVCKPMLVSPHRSVHMQADGKSPYGFVPTQARGTKMNIVVAKIFISLPKRK